MRNGTEISTRRIVRSGVVHEMADLGCDFLCGRRAPEPWTWTEKPVSCKRCLRTIERARVKADLDEYEYGGIHG